LKQLEIIQLRLTGNTQSKLINDIRRSVLAGIKSDNVRLYFHATVPTDLSIHIHLETNTRVSQPSDLGVRLAAAMREHGMVQHTVWIEDQSTNRGFIYET